MGQRREAILSPSPALVCQREETHCWQRPRNTINRNAAEDAEARRVSQITHRRYSYLRIRDGRLGDSCEPGMVLSNTHGAVLRKAGETPQNKASST